MNKIVRRIFTLLIIFVVLPISLFMFIPSKVEGMTSTRAKVDEKACPSKCTSSLCPNKNISCLKSNPECLNCVVSTIAKNVKDANDLSGVSLYPKDTNVNIHINYNEKGNNQLLHDIKPETSSNNNSDTSALYEQYDNGLPYTPNLTTGITTNTHHLNSNLNIMYDGSVLVPSMGTDLSELQKKEVLPDFH
jgi:hypothetical protein